MAQQIQLRRGTAALWTSTNPVLAVGEPGIEIDTNKLKIGDGVTAWNALGYQITAGDVTLSGTQILTNKTLTNPIVTNYVETVYAPAAGASFTVDLANGTVQKFTTNANATITLPASTAGKSYLIMVAYGGVHSVTWAGGTVIKWSGGTAPAATSVSGKFDIFAFTCDGTNTYGRSGGSNF